MSLLEFILLLAIVAAGTRIARKAGAAAGIPVLPIGVVLSLTTE